LNIGITFNGRQTPGGQNVIDGLLTALKTRPGSKLYGFLEGSVGLVENKVLEITEANFALYRN
jgi:6-phosphofructokinase